MTKRKKHTKAASSIRKANDDQKEGQKVDNREKHAEDENPFDFGGLPARDLKKNLGCG